MGVRSFLVRRALGRFRITEDITKHLSTFQRLGEHLEVEAPGEMLPVGARTVFRALRTRSAAQIGTDWVWPYWLERQLDPASPAFVPRGHLPFLTNVTARNWTAIGNIGSAREAIVDPRGLVTPWFDGWSLDWWIGADDRWHLPSREVAVRQRLVEDTPVIETAMRVPTGDAVQRVYAVNDGGQELVVVEIENRSTLPFAVAFAVRPCNPEGLAVVERIGLHDDTTVTVDGRVAMLLPRRPSRVAGSIFHNGDVASIVMSGDATESFPDGLRDDAGMASAAFIFPLPHTATIRIGLPIVPERRTRRRGLARRRAAKAPALPTSLPSAEQVAKGWGVHAGRGMRLELPDSRLASCVAANRAFLLLLHDGDEITPGPATYHRFWFRDAAYLLAALDRYGYDREVAEVLRSYPSRQHADGFFFSQSREWDANGAALHSIAEHWRLHRDRALLDELAASVAKGAEWIERKRHTARAPASRSRGSDEALRGLLPPGVSAEHLGPFDWFYWDDFWGLRGLLDAAEVLAAAGEQAAAADAARMAASLGTDIDRSLELTAKRLGTQAMPAGPRRRIDPGIIGSLVAGWPLRLFEPEDERLIATAEVVRDRFLVGDAFFQGISHTGLGTYLTLQLAFIELDAGDRRALDRLEWMLGAATPTWTWPEAVHPRLPGGCMGDGHHGWAAADLLSFVRNLLVREVPGPSGRLSAEHGGLALCTMVPDSWLGHGIEVHDAPTHLGQLSYAVRWHGDRPALLWELSKHDGVGDVRITAPGLDASWSSTDAKGDALLAPVPPPGQISAVSLRRP